MRAGAQSYGRVAGRRLALMLAVLGPLLGGCASFAGRIAADTLEAAILNERDAELVRDGLPAYLMLVDGMIERRPDNATLLAAGAQLSALYGSRFVTDSARAERMTARALAYGARAICLVHEPACTWHALDYDAFVVALNEVRPRHFAILHAYAESWLSHLQASGDWNAVADLPRVEALLERLLAMDETYANGNIHMYLGILNALRPPALGGQPEIAKRHFDRALELSEGKDLSAKVEYARHYARLVFDRELHDRLLEDVAAAPIEAPGLTLFNVLAKEEARALLETSAEYF